MPSERTLYLLDAMALAYRAYFAFLSRPRINSRGINTSCVYGFTTTLLKLISTHGLEYAAVVFDAPVKTFRSDMYAPYKAHRDPPPEELISNLPYIKQVAQALSIPVYEVAGVEADDVIGTLAKQAEASGSKAVIVSPDKDFQQLLSSCISLFKPSRRGEDFDRITEETFREKYDLSPIQFIDILALMGDKADNVPGIHGVGEKTAQKLILNYGSVENLIQHAPEVTGKKAREGLLNEPDMARLSKKLVTIHTDVPVPLDWEALKRGEVTAPATLGLFRQLEFRTLLERLTKDAPAAVAEENAPGAEESRAHYDKSSVNYRLITNHKELQLLERTLRKAPQIALHALLTDAPPLRADWVGLAVSWARNTACYIPLTLPDGTDSTTVLRILAPVLTNTTQTKIGHGIKPLIVNLGAHNIAMRGPVFDTEVAHYLLAPDSSHTLGFVARERLAYEPVELKAILGSGRSARNLRDITPTELVVHACEAADLAFRLKDVLEKSLAKQGLHKVASTMEFPLIYALAQMEETGVTIDLGRLDSIELRLKEDIARLEEKIFADAGKTFLIGSPQQVGHILFEHLELPVLQKTSSGQPSTKENVLLDLSTQHPLPGLIIDWRKATRLQGTYIHGLRRMVSKKGRVHTVFNQTVAATGRLSSSDPGLQNIPMRQPAGRELRRAFVAPEGRLLLSADYAQIELRILAHMSEDQGLADIFRSGRDLHTETAAHIFGIDADNVLREQRNKAKAVNYGIPYGLAPSGLAQQLRCSRQEAHDLMEIYHTSFPGIAAFLSRQVELARERGYAETLWGRRRYLPQITARNNAVRSAAERIAINMPIQGTQADMIKLAAVNLHDCFQHEGLVTRPILQVHDELVFEVPPYEKDIVAPLVRERMVTALPLSIPIEVDIHYGATWLDAH